METGISILKHIRTLLVSDKEFAKMVGEKVSPIVAEDNTTFPFVVLTRDSITPSYTKDGCLYDNVDFSVKVVAETYQQMIDICEAIRRILDNRKNERIDTIRVSNIGSEEFADDVYVQEIMFNAVFK